MADAAQAEVKSFSARSMKIGCFVLAVLIYVFFGTPTPEKIGVPEILSGFLLVCAVGIGGAYYALKIEQGAGWQIAARLLLVYALTVPLLTGLLNGNNVSSMLRDIIPFFFLLLPLFLVPLFAYDENRIKWLTALIAFGGYVFSLRVLVPYLTGTGIVSDPFLLANAPTVLFCALLLIGLSGMGLYRALPPPYALKGAVFFLAALVPVATMALITQRASIGAVCLMIVVLLAIGLWRKPLRVAVPLVIIMLALAFYWPVVTDVSQGLMRKTSLVGFNMRWQEALVVFDAVNSSFLSVMFGKGWGASIASPAVGGAVVNFTHSLLTTYWLKTGLIGLALVLFYLFRLGLMLWTFFWRHPVMAMALGGPFLIDILLYASFKSLDFGLVLMLIPLWYQITSPDNMKNK